MDFKSDTSFGQCSLSHNNVQSSSQLSSLTTTSESCGLSLVYQRKRRLPNPPAPLPSIGVKMSLDSINLVYGRRKHQRVAATNFIALISAHTSPNGACCSGTRSENPSATSVEKAGGVSFVSETACNKGLPLAGCETVDGGIVEDHGSELKDKSSKGIELHSVDDSCSSSSMLEMGVGSGGPLKAGIDDADECSTSGILGTDVMRDDLMVSATDLCISILRSHGLLSDHNERNKSRDSEEDPPPSCSGSRSCHVCSVSGPAEDMLICDECEEAFHVSCCNSCVRKMPVDDWYCHSCFKNKHKMTRNLSLRKSSIIRSGPCGEDAAPSVGDLSPIDLMLKDDEPYRSGIRVGKGFQAIVPEWSGPILDNFDVIPEPMEIDPSDSVELPGLIAGKPRVSSYIGNWLQCREVIIGLGEDIDGTVCGKWRRAPLFEVQTDKWDCFRSVLWDPTHSDCAAPQELETEEVLKQLKYIEMLRPRLEAKRWKVEVRNGNSHPAYTKDANKCTVVQTI